MRCTSPDALASTAALPCIHRERSIRHQKLCSRDNAGIEWLAATQSTCRYERSNDNRYQESIRYNAGGRESTLGPCEAAEQARCKRCSLTSDRTSLPRTVHRTTHKPVRTFQQPIQPLLVNPEGRLEITARACGDATVRRDSLATQGARSTQALLECVLTLATD